MIQLKRFFKSMNSRIFIIMGITTGSLILLIAGILIIRDFRMDRSVNKKEKVKMAYNLEKLNETIKRQTECDILFFEDLEELPLDIELYRTTELPWNHSEVSSFWIPADRKDIDYFTEANHQLIREILKDAP